MKSKIILTVLLLMVMPLTGMAKNIDIVKHEGGTKMEVVITKENFKKEVLESKLPVLVDFFATWCGPCKMLAPTVAEFAEENKGKIVVAKCDIDQCPELADEYRIQVVPTLIAFKNGKPVNATKGLCSKKQLLALFEE